MTAHPSLFAETDDRPAKARADFVAAYRAMERLHKLPAAALSITGCTVADGGTVVVAVVVDRALRLSGPQESAVDAAQVVFVSVVGDLR